MKTNTILIIIAALTLSGGAYYYFFTETGNDPSLSSAPLVSRTQTKFQTLANQLPTSLDASIFSDPRFNSLINISQPIRPEPTGRIDPFAPIPGAAISN